MDPETIFTALRKNAVLVAMHVALGAVLGLVLGLLTPPVYTSSASANVGTEQPDSSQPDSSVLNYMKDILPTLVEMGSSEAALSQVADATGLSKDEVRRSVSVSAKTETIIMEVSASHSDPEQARAIAEAEIAALDSAARDLSERSQNSDLTLTVTVIDEPSVPSSPSSLSAPRTAVIGAVIGLVAGAGMALLLFILHRKDPEGHAEAPLLVLGRRGKGGGSHSSQPGQPLPAPAAQASPAQPSHHIPAPAAQASPAQPGHPGHHIPAPATQASPAQPGHPGHHIPAPATQASPAQPGHPGQPVPAPAAQASPAQPGHPAGRVQPRRSIYSSPPGRTARPVLRHPAQAAPAAQPAQAAPHAESSEPTRRP